MDGVPQWVRGRHEPAGPRRPAPGHRRGGARPVGLLRPGQPPVPAATRPPTGSRSRARPPTTPTTPAGSTGRDDLWPTLAARQPPAVDRLAPLRAGPTGVPPRRRRRRAVLRPRRRRPAAHRVRPARLPHRRLPRRAAGHHLPLRARPRPPTCSWSRPTSRASSCPTRACSAATPCSTPPCSRCPRPRRSTRRASSPSS